MPHSPNHQPRRRFGQNFLEDDGVILRIVQAIHPRASDNLVEIGPGKGAITEHLLAACPALNVIELDRDLVPLLLARFIARYPDFKIYQSDALKFDFRQLLGADKGRLRVVGNLPYNISTPLIFHLLDYHTGIEDMHFMLQKEVVRRLAAPVGGKSYGRLSVMTQYYCQIESLFDVPPECFNPRPKVDSAIVRLTPHRQLPFPAQNLATLETLVNVAFQQRRKTLRNALKTLLSADQIAAGGVDPGVRPEQVALPQYVTLANGLDRRQHEEART